MTQRAGPHEDPLTASSGWPSDEVPESHQPHAFHRSPHQLTPRCCMQDLLPALGGGLPDVLRPTERPVRQRSGLAATEDWRPGRRRATWLPEEEQATQRHELSG